MSARMRFTQVVLIGMIVLVLGPAVRGNVLYVNGACGDDGWSGLDPNCAAPDGPKATIQAAINAAGVDDTIIVAPYRYYENINFNGQQIVLRSTNPLDPNVVAATVIDGSYPGVTFGGDETPETVLTGFTVRGGIEGAMSQATIANCVILGADVRGCDGLITDCIVAAGSGVAHCNGVIARCIVSGNVYSGISDCDGLITNCIVTGTPDDRAMGRGLSECDGLITNCIVAGNALYGLYMCDGNISNCTIVGNVYGGLVGCEGVTVVNSIVWDNRRAFPDYPPDHYQADYSCIQDWSGGGEGNVLADPGFALPVGGTWKADGMYDPKSYQVTLTDDEGNWSSNELAGRFINVDTTQGRQFIIIGNTSDTVAIWADWDTVRFASSWVAEGASYAIYDYHLEPGSPSINRGDPNGDYDGQTDIDGDDRVVHCRVDIGADEYTGLLMPFRPALVATEPAPNSTLPKTANNVLRLTFDVPIGLPGGMPLSVVNLDDGSEVADLFSYSTASDGFALIATENGAMLSNYTWYRVTPTSSLDVHDFAVDVCTLTGDADGSGLVGNRHFDYSAVKEHMGERTGTRYDLNGSGRITTADYSVVKAHWGESVPDKP